MIKTVALVSHNDEIVCGFRSIFSASCSYRLRIFTDFVGLKFFLRHQKADCILIEPKFLQSACVETEFLSLCDCCPVYFITCNDSEGKAEILQEEKIFAFPEDIPLLLNGEIIASDSNMMEFPADFIGISAQSAEIKKKILLAAQSDSPVLITGETGVGKGLVADLIHRLSSRKNHPLKSLNVTTIPAGLAESVLFGTVRGAFTDALTKEGYFEIARGTTLFLDEIGDLRADIQAKLLHVIEKGTFQSVGSHIEKTSDARLIFATNADLKKKIVLGEFRSDLYYRISHIVIHIPPLRERKEDIIPLARAYLAPSEKSLSASAELLLTSFDWRGNVRQLYNCLERAILLCGAEQIDVNHIVVD